MVTLLLFRCCTQHYAKLLPSNQQQEGASSSGADASKDISALIAQEVTDLKDKSKRVFQFHDTGIRGAFYVIFPNEPGKCLKAR